MNLIYHPDRICGDCMQSWVAYSILCLITWGLWGVVLKYAYQGGNWLQTYFASAITSFILAVSVFIAAKGSISPGRSLYYAMIAGLLGGAGYIFFTKALEAGKASIVIPLTALYPAVTAVIAFILLGEHIKPTQAVGLILALVAAVLLSL